MPQHTPDARAIALDTLKQRSSLSKVEVQELLVACTDTRKLSQEVVQRLLNAQAPYNVGEIAWKLLSQAWSMTSDAWSMVLQALTDENAIVCAAAAQLMQRGKDVPAAQRMEAMECIRMILADERLSYRPLDAPSGAILRLDDVLYDVLSALAA